MTDEIEALRPMAALLNLTPEQLAMDLARADYRPRVRVAGGKIRAFDVVSSQPWLITDTALQMILSIADRMGEDPQALATKLGRPLDNTRTVEKRPNGVAVVPINGPIFRYANIFTDISGATSTEVLATDIQAAIDDPNVSAIVLNIDSPGGAAAGINELANLIAAGSQKKRMVAYVGGLGASAAYWLAAAADTVVMDATAMVGSIGVVMSYEVADPKTAAKTIEIVSSTSPDKRLDPTTEMGRAKVQKVVDDLAAVFVASVAKNRGVDAEKVLSDFGRGGVIVGAQAVDLGMADRLGSLESVIAELAGSASNPVRRSSMTTQAKGPATVTTTAELQAAIAAGHKPEEITFDNAKAVADATMAASSKERARIKAILEHPEAKERAAFAQHLAFEGDTEADAAGALLAKFPKGAAAGKSAFEQQMERHSPGIRGEEMRDSEFVPTINSQSIFDARRKAAAQK